MRAGKKTAAVYVGDMVAAIERIERYAQAGREAFFRDGLIQDGIIRQLSVIGEAAARIPVAFRSRHRHIPWKDMVGMRNIIVHEYSDVDLPTIWATVTQDLRPLKRELLIVMDKKKVKKLAA